MAHNAQNGPNNEMINAMAEQLRSAHLFWNAEFHTVVGTIHFANKRNLPALFDLFVGKLHLYEIYIKACKLGLGELVRFVNSARFDLETKFNIWMYAEMEEVSEKLVNDPRIQRLERRYQRLCRYEDETIYFVARIKASLGNGEPLDSDDFVVVEAVEDCTTEMTMRLREAEILEKCISRTLRHIQRSLVAVKTFNGLMEEKLKDLTPEEIQRVPAANINIFEGDYLRVLTTKNREGVIVIEDAFAEIPERPAESSSEEEE